MNIRGYDNQFGELTTLISEPERGPFGNPAYRGNYAGGVLARLIGYLRKNGIPHPYVYDPMEGGKTSRDVCTHMGLPYVGADLHSGFDVVHDDFHDYGFDLTMLHYPYWKMIDYAADLPLHLQRKDMSRMGWSEFIEAVSHVNMKAAAHSRFVAVLVGDMAVRGGIKSIQREMAWPGMCVRHITKVQHNALSYRKQYNGNFIPIVTEHLILLRSDRDTKGFMIVLMSGGGKSVDADELVTWKTAVKHVSKENVNITPANVYAGIRQRFASKLQKTHTPEATIRRTLQELEAEGFLYRESRGIYKRAS